jgi:hypothetical protein
MPLRPLDYLPLMIGDVVTIFYDLTFAWDVLEVRAEKSFKRLEGGL